MENCFPNEYSKMKIFLKSCEARDPKKQFLSVRHPMLIKFGTLLLFSRCYAAVREKKKFG